MEIHRSSASKRFRSDASSANSSPSPPPTNLLDCPHCTFSTDSQVNYDFHNHVHHQHVCSQCLTVFPSYFLLDLHMDELHNSYSTLRLYRCLIESCTQTFTSANQRAQHLHDDHHTKHRHLNDLYAQFARTSLDDDDERSKSSTAGSRFGCDAQKTFVRNSRLKPRQHLDMNWDGDD